MKIEPVPWYDKAILFFCAAVSVYVAIAMLR